MNDELKYAEELVRALRNDYAPDICVMNDMRDGADLIDALIAENAELREAIANASKLIATMRNNKKAALWLRKYQLPDPPQKGE